MRLSWLLLFPLVAAQLRNDPNIGLPDGGLKTGSGISFGMLPDFNIEGPQELNKALGGYISVIGDYVHLSPESHSYRDIMWMLDRVRPFATARVPAVYCAAIRFSTSLTDWDKSVTEDLVEWARQANRRGIKLYLRLLYEFNGDWNPYGHQPDEFIRVFREVADAIHSSTTDTLMMWSPNIYNDDTTSLNSYVRYFPGEQYVDVAGMSLYWFGINQRENSLPPTNFFLNELRPFYELIDPEDLSSNKNALKLTKPLPLVIAESGAPVYYNTAGTRYADYEGEAEVHEHPDLTNFEFSLSSPPRPNSTDELMVKSQWFQQLTSTNVSTSFPQLKAICWFNLLKISATGGKLADYRAVGGNLSVEAFFRNYIGNQTLYMEGWDGAASALGVSWILIPVAFLVSLWTVFY